MEACTLFVRLFIAQERKLDYASGMAPEAKIYTERIDDIPGGAVESKRSVCLFEADTPSPSVNQDRFANELCFIIGC